MVIKQVKVLKPFDGYVAGQVVNVKFTSDTGVARLPEWRRRLKDAERDQCCEIVEDEKPTPSKVAPVAEPKEATGKKSTKKTAKKTDSSK